MVLVNERERLEVMLLRLRDVAERFRCQTEVVPRSIGARVERRRAPEGVGGLFVPALLVVDAAEIVRNLGVVGGARRGAFQRLFRVGVAGEEVQRPGLHLQGGHVLRVFSGDAIERCDRVGGLLRQQLRLGECEKQWCARAAFGHGTSELDDGAIVLPRLVRLPRERLRLLAVLAPVARTARSSKRFTSSVLSRRSPTHVGRSVARHGRKRPGLALHCPQHAVRNQKMRNRRAVA